MKLAIDTEKDPIEDLQKAMRQIEVRLKKSKTAMEIFKSTLYMLDKENDRIDADVLVSKSGLSWEEYGTCLDKLIEEGYVNEVEQGILEIASKSSKMDRFLIRKYRVIIATVLYNMSNREKPSMFEEVTTTRPTKDEILLDIPSLFGEFVKLAKEYRIVVYPEYFKLALDKLMDREYCACMAEPFYLEKMENNLLRVVFGVN